MVRVAATHRGALNTIPDTGSPMAEIGMALPSLFVVQSASEMVLLPSIDVSCRAAAVTQTVLTKTRTVATHFVLFGIADFSRTGGLSCLRIRRDDPNSNCSQIPVMYQFENQEADIPS
jgi:hypothetical protein